MALRNLPRTALMALALSSPLLLVDCGSQTSSGAAPAATSLITTPSGTAYGSNPVISVLAGQPAGPTFADGSAASARFNEPGAVAIDSKGNLFVVDVGNSLIREVLATGSVTTLAGTLGISGAADGLGTAASFNAPRGIVVDGLGNLYVADTGNHVIRKITPANQVSTLAGNTSAAGQVDGSGNSAQFSAPAGMAISSQGIIFIADRATHSIRQMDTNGTVTTLAGSGKAGNADGVGNSAAFNQPSAVAIDAFNNVYVADTGNYLIRKITPTGVVTTIAGTLGSSGSTDGDGSVATFTDLQGIVVSVDGKTLYVNDQHRVRALQFNPGTTTYTVSTYVGAPVGNAFSIGHAIGLAMGSSNKLFLSDRDSDTIQQVTNTGGTVANSTYAGVSPPSSETPLPGYVEGVQTAARFSSPSGLALDASGNLLVADQANSLVRKVSPTGITSAMAGLASTPGIANGPGPSARLSAPNGLATDNSGNTYIVDSTANTVRVISPAGIVSTLAGTANVTGSADGTGTAATFNNPNGVAVDGSGNLYVTDTGNSTIRRISPTGVVTTLAGKVGNSGNTDGKGSAALFSNPQGIAVSKSGVVYVADTNNSVIRAITPDGTVSTLAGKALQGGSVDGTGSAARFNLPVGLAIDAAGNLFVTDYGNNTVRMVTSAGVVSTAAGQPGVQAVVTGVNGSLSMPTGIAVDANDTLYVTSENSVLVINAGTQPLVRISASPTTIFLNNATTLTWWSSSNSNACTTSGDWTQTIKAQGSLGQAPANVGTSNYGITCTSNGGSASASVAVSVVEAPPVPTVSITTNPGTITLGQSSNLSWTSTNASDCVATGDWTGSQGPSGNFPVEPAASGVFTYALTCAGPSGSTQKASTTLTVNAAATANSGGSSGGTTATSSSHHGGAVGAYWFTLLLLLGFVRARTAAL